MDRSPRAESSRSYDGDRHRYRERSDRDRGSSYRDRDRDREHRDRDRDRDHRDRGRGRREERDDQPVDPERAIFVGNLDTYSTIDEVREMFEGLGEVRRVDMKQGFAFVFLESGHHRAVRELDGKLHNRKHLRVELARGDGLVKRREDDRRREQGKHPNDTLFVVNFDVTSTHARDLEDLFRPYGRIERIELKRNFAFVQFKSVDEATRALNALNGYKLVDRYLTVEYVSRKGDSRKRGRSPSPFRGRGGSPPPRRRSISRSPSPRRRRYDDPYEGRDLRRFNDSEAASEDKGGRYDEPPPSRDRRFEESSSYRH